MISKTGLIISSTKYKDFDAIINVLFEDNLDSILIRGAYRKNNANFSFTNTMLLANLEIYKGKVGGYKLKNGKILNSYQNIYSNYYSIVVLNLINEVLRKCLIDIEFNKIYKLTLTTLKGLDEFKNPDKCLCFFLLKLTKLLGAQLNLDECVRSKEKNNLCAISFIDGGAISVDMVNDEDMAVDITTMNILKNIYKNDSFKEFNGLSDEYIKKIIIGIIALLEHYFSIKINSLSLL